MFRLVAIVGLAGSGKSEVVKAFEAAGFTKIYFGGLTIEKLKEANFEINEPNERMMREKLRRDHGMAAYATLNLPKIKEGLKKVSIIIDGLYSWEEYLVLKKEFPALEVVAVQASPKIRYQRLTTRPIRPLTKAEAESRDYAQIENLHQAGPIVMANRTIINEGSLAELEKQVSLILGEKNGKN
ncbi:MAG TPA: AAA family ATPase [Candidatus Saccharimonadales bacterium]|nr:AAA family ATPase [Candidatus Saccharimonadales bacterium]